MNRPIDISALKDLIGNGEINRIFSFTENQIVSKSAKNSFLIFKNNYQDLEKNKMKGILSEKEYFIQKNTILTNLIEFLDTLTENDLGQSITEKKVKKEDSFLEELRIHGERRRLLDDSGEFKFKREVIKLKKEIIDKFYQYADIGFYKLKKDKSKDGFTITVDELCLTFGYCPRAIVLGINDNRTDDYQAILSGVFMLNISHKGELVWQELRIKDDTNIKEYSTNALAELLTRVFFKKLITPKKTVMAKPQLKGRMKLNRGRK